MNACSSDHIWDSYMACLKLNGSYVVVQLSLMSVALASKTFMYWAFKKTLQTSNIIKIKDLKTANKDHKKATKQGSRYCSVGIQFLSYKSLF